MVLGPTASWQIEVEKVEAVTDFLFLGSKITADGDCSHEIRRWLLLDRKAITNLDSCVEKQRHHSADKGPYSLPSGYIQLQELDHEEGSVTKNWCLQTVVLEKTPENPLDSKEIKPVNLRENKPWILTGRTDAEAEAPVFWSPDMNSQLTGKVPDAGKDWGQKRVSEDKLSGCYHQRNGHELGQTPGDGEGQQGLACCSPWGCKESGMTVWLKHKVCAQEWDCWVLLRFFFKDFQHHFCVFKKSLHISNFKKVCFLGSYFLFF